MSYLHRVNIAEEGFESVVVIAGVRGGGGIAGRRGEHVQGRTQQTLYQPVS